MSIERAEQLKKELTDKWVGVVTGIPELRRFQKFTGRVKTVNMNCRALVEFLGSEDISWYDIDPQFLTVVDVPKETEKQGDGEKAQPKTKPAAKSAPVQAASGSPLDQIRAQAGGAAPEKPKAGGSPLEQIRAQAAGESTAKSAPVQAASGSPLDQIRAQAGGAAPEKPKAGGSPLEQIRAQAAGESTAKSAPVKPKADSGSPLDQIRAQAAAAAAPAAKQLPDTENPAAQAAVEETPEAAPPPPPPDAPAIDTSAMSPLDIIRAQGAFKGNK